MILAAAAAALACRSFALSAADLASAASAGTTMALARQPYKVAPWVRYQSADPLRATHGRADIDAVIVETPYERVRNDDYLDALQFGRPSRATVASLGRDANGLLGILVYAHSKTEFDAAFLSKFSAATLALPGGPVLHPVQTARFGPSSDFYDVGSFREARYIGTITYRFRVPGCVSRATVAFADGYGRRYVFPLDLARYR